MVATGGSTDARVLELVGDVQGLLELDEFREGLIVALMRTVPSDWVSLNQVSADPAEVWALVVPALDEETHEGFARYGHQNPLVRRALETRDSRAYRLSDVISQDDFHELDLYREVYSKIGLEHQLAFLLPFEPPRLLGVALSRKHNDFTEEERDVVERARPFLIQSYRNAIEHTRLVARTDAGTLLRALGGAGLTPREAEAMAQVALRRSNDDTAKALGLSVRTVHKHLERAFSKLGVHTRADAAAVAWSLIQEPDGTTPPRRTAPDH